MSKERIVGLSQPPTLDDLLADYPIRMETYSYQGFKDGSRERVEKTAQAEIARNSEGKIVYVLPGSARILEEKKDA